MPEAQAAASTRGGTVHVTVPASVADNLQMMQKLTGSILKKLGCAACHSGFDIRWLREDLYFKADIRGEISASIPR